MSTDRKRGLIKKEVQREKENQRKTYRNREGRRVGQKGKRRRKEEKEVVLPGQVAAEDR